MGGRASTVQAALTVRGYYSHYYYYYSHYYYYYYYYYYYPLTHSDLTVAHCFHRAQGLGLVWSTGLGLGLGLGLGP